MPYQGIIFDLDGTLLDTLADLAGSVNQALGEDGYPEHSVESYKTVIGHGFRDLVTRSLPEADRSEAVVEKTLRRFLEIYDANYTVMTKPYPGIASLVDTLAGLGIKLGVNSNKRNDYTENLIKLSFPGILFDGVFGEREGVAKKPDPAAALEIAALMEIPPAEILYVGDSKTDMQTGKNGGMDCGGVLWGFRDSGELLRHGAKYLFTTPEELAALFNTPGNSSNRPA